MLEVHPNGLSPSITMICATGIVVADDPQTRARDVVRRVMGLGHNAVRTEADEAWFADTLHTATSNLGEAAAIQRLLALRRST